MLVRFSGHFNEGLFLFTLGESAHYALAAVDSGFSPRITPSSPNQPAVAVGGRRRESDRTSVVANDHGPDPRLTQIPFVLFDPGSTAHAQQLALRIERTGLRIENLSLILLTHLHPERCAGAAWLCSQAPHARVVGSSAMQRLLSDEEFSRSLQDQDASWVREFSSTPSALEPAPAGNASRLAIHEQVADGEVLAVGDSSTIRVFSAPGHTAESLWYLIQPHGVLICDDLIGHYRGRLPPSPTADHGIDVAQDSLKRLERVSWKAIGLPFGGILTGKPALELPKQVSTVLQQVKSQIEQARLENIPDSDIESALREQLFASSSRDPVLHAVRERSIAKLLRAFPSSSKATQPESPSPESSAASSLVK